jgi:TonB family protein
VFALMVLVFFAGCFGGGRSRSAAPVDSRYSNMLHSRFYRAWEQPAVLNASRGKVSVPVDVQIDAKGRVSGFKLVQSSGYPELDASIRAVATRVREVEPPPSLAGSGVFQLRIFFDLDVKR